MLWDWRIWLALMCCGINGRFSLIVVKRRILELLKVEELLQQPFNWVMGRSLSLISRPSQQKLRTRLPYELPFFRRNFTISSSPLRQAPCKIETNELHQCLTKIEQSMWWSKSACWHHWRWCQHVLLNAVQDEILILRLFIWTGHEDQDVCYPCSVACPMWPCGHYFNQFLP